MESTPLTISPKNNRLALTSMILGIIGLVLLIILACLFWGVLPLFTVATIGIGAVVYICVVPLMCLPPLVSLAAVITGHIGKNQIKQTGEGGNGMATTGLITGYIGLALVLLSICIISIVAIAGGSIPIFDQIFNQWPSY